MKIYINEITGLGQSFESLLMSKRSWTPQKAFDLYKLAYENTTREGFVLPGAEPKFKSQMDKIIKWGVEAGHTTLIRFIDLSITVEGLHRGGQDDLDSHAARMDNRIVRASTRLGKFKEGEVSDYYRDKIKFDYEIIEEALGIMLPAEYIDEYGVKFIKSDYGYIREDLKDSQDVKRGLYPLSIPSNFTFKIQYPEFCHIYQHRNGLSHAHPELQECMEMIAQELSVANTWLFDNLNRVKMQKVGE